MTSHYEEYAKLIWLFYTVVVFSLFFDLNVYLFFFVLSCESIIYVIDSPLLKVKIVF